jgi:uncharacterized LabA/DUF88 family protein
MDRVGIFVDAGYLFAQGSTALTGRKCPRGDVYLNIDHLLEELKQFASRQSGREVLRIYWYDGTSTGPSSQHTALAHKPCVKVRLGFVNTAGLQKGVDSLIVTDIIRLAMNRAICDAVLLSGDEDLRVGVQQAQEFGVKVHLLGIAPSRGSQSQFLMQEADTTHEWTRADVAKFLSHTPRATGTSVPTVPIPWPSTVTSSTSTPAAPAAPTAVVSVAAPATLPTAPPTPPPATLAALAKQNAGNVDLTKIEPILTAFNATRRIPEGFDRPLLGAAKRFFGNLGREQLKELRAEFIAELRLRSTASSGRPVT